MNKKKTSHSVNNREVLKTFIHITVCNEIFTCINDLYSSVRDTGTIRLVFTVCVECALIFSTFFSDISDYWNSALKL